MLNPRPLQLLQMVVLGLLMLLSLNGERVKNLGAFPAQLRQVRTVRPPMQEVWVGSRSRVEAWLTMLNEVLLLMRVDEDGW